MIEEAKETAVSSVNTNELSAFQLVNTSFVYLFSHHSLQKATVRSNVEDGTFWNVSNYAS